MFDPSNDLALVTDGLEAVTLLRRYSTADTGETIAHAFRRAITASEAAILERGDVRKSVASDGKYMATDVVWHLPAPEPTEAPKLGDVILDGEGQRWTILEVKRATLSSRWRCDTRNLAVAFGLDDTISILKEVEGLSGPEWQLWQTGIRARIQPTARQVTGRTSTPRTTATYRIFIEQNVELDHTHAVRGADGKIYTITGTSGMDRIAELQVVEVEIVLD